MLNKPVLRAILCLSFVAAAQGQNVFVLPGANGTGNTIQVLSSQFTSVGSVAVGSSPFLVLAKPDGSKYYAIANSGSQTVTAFDSAFSNPRSLGSLGSQATAAVLTPDGKKLLVVAGSLHVIDTATDSDLLPNGIVPGTPFTDVAVSLDGTRAFVLGATQVGQGVLYAVELSSGQYSVVANLPLNNITTSVSTGPDGYIYVGAVNRVYEIDPVSLQKTPAGEIQTLIKAGKVTFTPDGKYALATNQTPTQSSPAAMVIDLTSHTVATYSAALGNSLIDKLLVASNTLAYGFSAQTASLYQFTLPGMAVSAPNFTGINGLSLTGAALSNDVASPTHPSAQSLFLVASNNVYRVDIPTSTVTGPVAALNTISQAISVTGPFTSAATTPVTILPYGGNVGLAQGVTSGPVVARVLDANGNPIYGTTVTFATTTGGVTIQNPAAITGWNGYAVTTFTAPTTSGQLILTATAGGATASYTFTIGTTSTGGGPASTVSIVAGQGQVLFQNYFTNIPGQGSPLLVKVTDVNGNPAANAQVTFDIATGYGTLQPGVSPDGTIQYSGTPAPDGVGTIVITDANGMAAAGFLSSTIQPFSGSSQTTVMASAPGANSVTFFITVTNFNFPPTAFLLSPLPGSTLTGASGSTVKGAITVAVVDGFGVAIPNVSVRLIDPATWGFDPTRAPNNLNVKCNDPTGAGILTDATGKAVCDVVFTGKAASNIQTLIDVGYHYAPGPVNLVITPGAPAVVQKGGGDGQTGNAGQRLPGALLVTVTDASGSILPNTAVTFRVVTPGTATLSNVSSATDQNGRASALLTLGNIAGTFQVTVTAGSAVATFNYTVVIPAAGIQQISGSGQIAVTNTPFPQPLVVQVLNGSNQPVAGAQVTFGVSGGTATLGSQTVTTDANGQASTTVTAGASAGPVTVTASVGGFSTAFSLTVRLPGPTNVNFLNGASFQPGISPGSIAVITGVGLLPGVQGVVRPTNLVGQLPTTLSGFNITFNGVAAPIFYVSNQGGSEQVSIQVPFETAPGTANVVITSSGGGTAPLNVPIQPVAPGIFETQDSSGLNIAVVIRPDGSYVSAANPAIRGEVDCTFATGLGQTMPAIATNSVGIANQNVVDPMDFGLNNAGVRLVSAATLPGSVGIYLVCFQVPLDTAAGSRQPVGMIVHDPSGDVFAQGTFIPIQ